MAPVQAPPHLDLVPRRAQGGPLTLYPPLPHERGGQLPRRGNDVSASGLQPVSPTLYRAPLSEALGLWPLPSAAPAPPWTPQLQQGAVCFPSPGTQALGMGTSDPSLTPLSPTRSPGASCSPLPAAAWTALPPLPFPTSKLVPSFKV